MADEKDSKWQCYIIPDLATWTGAAGRPLSFTTATNRQRLGSKSCVRNPTTAKKCRVHG